MLCNLQFVRGGYRVAFFFFLHIRKAKTIPCHPQLLASLPCRQTGHCLLAAVTTAFRAATRGVQPDRSDQNRKFQNRSNRILNRNRTGFSDPVRFWTGKLDFALQFQFPIAKQNIMLCFAPTCSTLFCSVLVFKGWCIFFFLKENHKSGFSHPNRGLPILNRIGTGNQKSRVVHYFHGSEFNPFGPEPEFPVWSGLVFRSKPENEHP